MRGHLIHSGHRSNHFDWKNWPSATHRSPFGGWGFSPKKNTPATSPAVLNKSDIPSCLRTRSWYLSCMKHENKTAWKRKTPKHVRRIVHPYSGPMWVHSGAWVIAALMWPYHVTKEQKGGIIISSTICRQICWSWCWDAYKFEAVISWNQNYIIEPI